MTMQSKPRWIERLWYRSSFGPALVLLAPVSVLFAAVVTARRAAYRTGLLRVAHLSRPVIVVGNITVGGVGKTPIVIWLATRLAAQGCRVGVVLRGYGGRSAQWPRDVDSATSTLEVGDEAVLIAARTQAIVVAGPDRTACARRAIERGAQIVLSDDGLQHYALGRDLEIAVLDAQRGVGNGWLLPAGPLREPVDRLARADFVVVHHREGAGATTRLPVNHVPVRSVLRQAMNLVTGEARALSSFAGQRVHALAAIGNPQAFFNALHTHGLDVQEHSFADHAELDARDLAFADGAPVLMTEKDAVKCRAFAAPHCWAVRLELVFDEPAAAALLARIDELAANAISR